MALPVWGNLDKSQIDPEKIEEAIARLIQNHEDDPNAHVETGESLHSHKAAEIIDHLIQSIVADKTSAKQVVFRTGFDSIDSWEHFGEPATLSWPGVQIKTTNVANNKTSIGTVSMGISDFLTLSKNLLFQTSLHVNSASNIEWYAHWGPLSTDLGGEHGFGFRYVGGNLQAFFHDGIEFHTENIAGIDTTNNHIYRAQVNWANTEITFYIDGILKATISCAGSVYSENRGPRFEVKTLENAIKRLFISEVFLAEDS